MLNDLEIISLAAAVFFLASALFLLRYISTLKQKSALENELISCLKDKEFLSEALRNSNSEIEQLKAENISKSEQIIAGQKEAIKLNEELKNLRLNLSEKSSALDELESKLSALQQRFERINTSEQIQIERIKIYEKNQAALEEKYAQSLKTLESNLKEQNEKSARLIYEENTKVLLANSNELLSRLFSPLQEQISAYEKSLIKQNTSIENNIKTMFESSQNLGKKAEEFAQILRGDKKARGDFGEIMLKGCLESSGLIENQHFFLQNSFKDEENKHKRPDAIVYFEPKKCVIIDAKFSLPSSDEPELAKKQIANNLAERINELAKKDYESAIEYANEYILLFVPYQNILDLALEGDAQIFKKAESKKIFLVSPTTLFMGLKMIYFGWQNYDMNQNALKIFNEFGKFYDKFCSFYDDYEKLKEQSSKSFEKIDTHLYGKGSIAKRLENLRDLGIKNKKTLSTTAQKSIDLLDSASLSDEATE